MAFEDISGIRGPVSSDSLTWPSAASGTPLHGTYWYTLSPLTITKIVGMASGNTAGTTMKLKLWVNGNSKGLANATLIANLGSKTFSFNGLAATAPANAWVGYALHTAAATAGANPHLFTYYHHGMVR